MSSSTAVCRAFAVVLFVSASCALVVSLCALPPIAERWILADGNIDTARARILLYACSCVGLVASGAMLWGSWALWKRAPAADSRRLTRVALTAGSSLVLALVLVEGGVRAFVPIERVLSREALRYHDWNASDWHSKDREYMPSIAVNAELGWAPRPGFRSESVAVNSAGFRGRQEYTIEKPGQVRRIILIGDSYTWGERTWTAETRDEDTFGEQLGALLARVEVMNLGVSGYGSDQALLRLQQRGIQYSPDLVVLGIFSEDLDRNTYRFHTYAKPYFTLEDDRLRLRGTPIPSEAEVRAEWDPSQKPSVFLWAVLRKSWDQVLKRTRFAAKWRLSEEILDECLNTVTQSGARFLVLHFPVEGDLDHPDGTELHLRRWSAAKGVPFVALRETFAAVPSEQRGHVYNGHLTPFGNRLVAEALRVTIVNEHLIE